MSVGRIRRLGDLADTIGLEFRIEVDQHISPRYVLGTDQKKPTYWLTQVRPMPGLIDATTDAVPLPKEEIEKAVPSCRPFLQGNVVIMPRSCEQAIFVEPPVATKFMIVAAFPAFGGRPLPKDLKRMLQALAEYMSTRLFRYLCFINGRRMTIDRPSIELSAVLELPWPFNDLDDPRLAELISADDASREELVASALGLPASYQAIAREFDEFRKGFSDGRTPPGATERANSGQMGSYLKALIDQIDGDKRRHLAGVEIFEDDLAGAMVRYVGSRGEVDQRENAEIIKRAYADYALEGASSLTQSRYLWHSPQEMVSVLIKPRERLHWTLERAFSDADLIAAAVMAGARIGVAT